MSSKPQISTPAFIVDLEKLILNCERMLARARRLGVSLRPHVKTHKSVPVLLIQHLGRQALDFLDLRTGAVDLPALLHCAAQGALAAALPLRCCVSTIGEAGHFLRSGLPLDVCVAVPCGADARKLRKIEALVRRFALPPAQGPRNDRPTSVVYVNLDSRAALAATAAFAAAQNARHRAEGQPPTPWRVFLSVDMGYRREGVAPEDPESLALVREIVRAEPHVALHGIYAHAGNAYGSKTPSEALSFAEVERDVLVNFAKQIQEMISSSSTFISSSSSSSSSITTTVTSLDTTESTTTTGTSNPNDAPHIIPFLPPSLRSFQIGIGSTPTCSNPPPHLDGITEIHPGNYVYYDLHQAAIGSCAEDDIAGAVLCTIVAHYPHRMQMMVDGGALAFSKDPGAAHLPGSGFPDRGWGVSPDAQGLRLKSISQEMGVLECPSGSFDDTSLATGKRMRFYPHHSCLAAACFPKLVVVAGSDPNQLEILGKWKCSPRKW